MSGKAGASHLVYSWRYPQPGIGDESLTRVLDTGRLVVIVTGLLMFIGCILGAAGFFSWFGWDTRSEDWFKDLRDMIVLIEMTLLVHNA
ncbi:hypothetical protein LO763_11435 [Glycomyces sp. A-F 0318]|uniref:hypothetical protein n=1 Tax=Glycomyces amatae TaxID=2881355 RepID=UPI001E6004EE|nr:hypothetical protein [Glycomyces amatae]MCD0444234.1 hypothetical protein [Glycomyces amatae]